MPVGSVVHLYRCEIWSTYRIGTAVGLSHQRVARMLRAAGVQLRARGAGGRRRDRGAGEPANVAQLLRWLYLDCRMSARECGIALGMPTRTVHDRLVEYGIPRRPRGRFARADRRVLPKAAIEALYGAAGLTAAQVAAQLGTSRGVVLRNAHEWGVPVRRGGAVPTTGPADIVLLDALYADERVAAVLRRYRVPVVAAGGPLTERFPQPVPLTADLLTALYTEAGLSTVDIELLTGWPCLTITRRLHRIGVAMRPPGGRSPFRRRWDNRSTARR